MSLSFLCFFLKVLAWRIYSILPSVLGQAVISAYRRLGGLSNKNLFLTVLEFRSPKSRCQYHWVLRRALFWVVKYNFLLCPYIVESREEARCLDSYKNTDPIHEASTYMILSNPNYFPKIPTLNTIILRSEFQRNFGGCFILSIHHLFHQDHPPKDLSSFQKELHPSASTGTAYFLGLQYSYHSGNTWTSFLSPPLWCICCF